MWEPRWEDKVLEVQRAGKGLAPYVLCAKQLDEVPSGHRDVLEKHGGKFISCPTSEPGVDGGQRRFSWADILQVLHKENLASVMIEGGGQIINSLLHPSNHQLIDSVIVTIAPVWLGRGSVTVSPDRVQDEHGTAVPAARLSDVSWHPMGEDVVLCGGLQG